MATQEPMKKKKIEHSPPDAGGLGNMFLDPTRPELRNYMKQEIIRLKNMSTTDLEDEIKQELQIPLPRGHNAKDRSWMLEAMIRCKHLQFYTKEIKQQPPEDAVRSHIKFLKASKQRSSMIGMIVNWCGDPEIVEELDSGERIVRKLKKGELEEIREAEAVKVARGKKEKKEVVKATKATKATKVVPVKKASREAEGRGNITDGKRIVALKHEFRRKNSNQARVFQLIVDAGPKGLTFEQLHAQIEKKVPTEKKPKEAAWHAFWYMAQKQGWAKLVD